MYNLGSLRNELMLPPELRAGHDTDGDDELDELMILGTPNMGTTPSDFLSLTKHMPLGGSGGGSFGASSLGAGTGLSGLRTCSQRAQLPQAREEDEDNMVRRE